MVLAAEDLGDFAGDLMGCLVGGGTDEEVFKVQQSVHQSASCSRETKAGLLPVMRRSGESIRAALGGCELDD